MTCDIFLCSENRYVLFLTENYAALDVLKNPKNYLSGEMSIVTPVLSEEQSVKSKEESSKTTEPFILFGSSFPKDKEYTQVGDVSKARSDQSAILSIMVPLASH